MEPMQHSTRAESAIPYGLVANTRLLELILLPTEKCNFRCSYCYEKFDIGRMKPATVRGIANLISARSEDLDHLQVSWFGGEPLLAQDIIRDVCGHALSLSRGGDFAFTSSMTTNGHLLTLPVAKEMFDLGVTEYQVTLDGPEEFHDRVRMQKTKGGTFRTIIDNLEQIKKSSLPVKFNIRIHMSPDNVHLLDGFIDFLKERFEIGADERFSAYIHAVGRWGGPNDEDINVFDSREQQHSFARKFSLKLGKPDDHDDDGYICYAAKANSFVIRADGRVGKCTLALYDERNTIGRIAEDGALVIDKNKLRPWVRGILENDRSIMGCPYSHF
jgi:uncharacterized protein